jgi:hypothetical protein
MDVVQNEPGSETVGGYERVTLFSMRDEIRRLIS